MGVLKAEGERDLTDGVTRAEEAVLRLLDKEVADVFAGVLGGLAPQEVTKVVRRVAQGLGAHRDGGQSLDRGPARLEVLDEKGLEAGYHALVRVSSGDELASVESPTIREQKLKLGLILRSVRWGPSPVLAPIPTVPPVRLRWALRARSRSASTVTFSRRFQTGRRSRDPGPYPINGPTQEDLSRRCPVLRQVGAT